MPWQPGLWYWMKWVGLWIRVTNSRKEGNSDHYLRVNSWVFSDAYISRSERELNTNRPWMINQKVPETSLLVVRTMHCNACLNNRPNYSMPNMCFQNKRKKRVSTCEMSPVYTKETVLGHLNGMGLKMIKSTQQRYYLYQPINCTQPKYV